MFARLICLFKGHAWRRVSLARDGFRSVKVALCSRCRAMRF